MSFGSGFTFGSQQQPQQQQQQPTGFGGFGASTSTATPGWLSILNACTSLQRTRVTDRNAPPSRITLAALGAPLHAPAIQPSDSNSSSSRAMLSVSLKVSPRRSSVCCPRPCPCPWFFMRCAAPRTAESADCLLQSLVAKGGSTGGFGAPSASAPTFGAPAASTTGFGGFGAPPAQQQPASTGLFGSAGQNKPFSFGELFRLADSPASSRARLALPADCDGTSI